MGYSNKTMMSHATLMKYWERLKDLESFKALFGIIKDNSEAWESPLSHMQMTVAVWLFIESSADWQTTCVTCGHLMDKNYEMYVQLDKIRGILNSPSADVESK